MSSTNLKLGVNIDHVATLRQVRGTTYPNPLEAARLCLKAGAHGITVHLREDRRHIQDADVYALRRECPMVLNLEMAPVPSIVKIALDVVPDEVCLVPERREERTTEGGLNVAGQKADLQPVIEALSQAGIKVSLFIEPTSEQVKAAAELGTPVIELHTGSHCSANEKNAPPELQKLIHAAILAHDLRLQVNAGHGIHMKNITSILNIPHLDTLNIGHSIVARALFVGLENAVKEMLTAMSSY